MQKNCKATFVLPTALLAELRGLVDAGLAGSLSALVRQGLELHARQLREDLLAREFLEASQDPIFVQDLDDCMRDFEGLTAEGLDG